MSDIAKGSTLMLMTIFGAAYFLLGVSFAALVEGSTAFNGVSRDVVGAVLVGGSIGYFVGKYALAPWLRRNEVWPYNA